MSELDLRPLRVYFFTSCKEGDATLTVQHTWSTETLDLPLHPSSAVAEALPLLEPAFAHYVAQWERFMVPDVDDRDTVGFWLPPDGLPEHIAPPANWDQLSEIAWEHTPDHVRAFHGERRPRAIYRWDPAVIGHSNIDDIVVRPDELGIDPLPGEIS